MQDRLELQRFGLQYTRLQGSNDKNTRALALDGYTGLDLTRISISLSGIEVEKTLTIAGLQGPKDFGMLNYSVLPLSHELINAQKMVPSF